MTHLSISIYLLLGVSLLIYLGLLHRVLDRLYLSSRGALLVIIAMIVGSYLPDITIVGRMSINVAGMVIPLSLVIYILYRSQSRIEQGRTLLVAGLVAFSFHFTNIYLPVEPGALGIDLDPLFLPAPIAAISAYLLGRSRRAAFCGAILGVFLVELTWVGRGSTLGGGGLFDVMVISGILAVLITEAFGELMERLNRRQGSG